MGIFDRSKTQKQMINILIFYIFIALTLLIILLILKSSQLSTITSATVSQVRLGPFDLMQIQKMPLDNGGYQATIKMLPGIFIYFGLWAVIAGLTIFFKINNSNRN